MATEDIFGDVLLDHSRFPRNAGRIENPDHSEEGANPLCGDEIVLDVKVVDGVIKQIAFKSRACAICTASTSMFCENANGLTPEQIDAMRDAFHRYLHGEELTNEERHLLGDALALEGVSKLPSRVKCAALVYETWAELRKKIA